MSLEISPLPSTFLGLAALIAGLALLVQVLQEVYKNLSSSKARTYRKVLEDVAGGWIRQLLTRDLAPDLLGRKPFQLWRWSPDGELLPLDRDTLIASAERTAPPWVRRALDALMLEAQLQASSAAGSASGAGATGPSPQWSTFLNDLWSAEPGSPGYRSALEVRALLARWDAASIKQRKEQAEEVHPPKRLRAEQLLVALRHELLPHVIHLEEHHEQLMSRLEHAYRRRNLRQTFTFALLLALACNLPFEQLYQRAAPMSRTEAVALLKSNLDRSRQQESPQQESPQQESPGKGNRPNASPAEPERGAASSAPRPEPAKATAKDQDATGVDYVISPADLGNLITHPLQGLRYLLGCLITALAITFGAPLINDLAGLAMRLGRRPGGQTQGGSQ